MFCFDYGDASVQDGVVMVRSDPTDLVGTMRESDQSWRLMIWRGAFDTPVVRRAMGKPDWPLRLLSAMELSNDWPWRAEKGGYGPVDDQSEVMTALSRSSGARGPAHGNILLSLRIREFDDRSSLVGGLNWWKDQIARLRGDDEFPLSFVNQIVSVLEQLDSLGSSVFVEQLSVVLNKDEDQPLCSITPMLHTDVNAGAWGASVSSLLEEGFNPYGGAMFLPTSIMSELDHLSPITLENLPRRLDSVPFLATSSGDMLIFDGMIDKLGTSDRRNGIPHISADTVGRSARLALLMYHADLPPKAA
jgi:hypothetical protein